MGADGKPVRERGGLDGEVRVLAFGADGKLLAGAASTGRVQVWEAASGAAKMKSWVYRVRIQALAISPDGRRLAVGNELSFQLTEIATTTAEPTVPANGCRW